MSATVETQWSGGYVVQPVNVTAGGAISGWTVTFTLPSGHMIANMWNASYTTSGQAVTARNMGYNGNLGAGGTTNFGFQVNRPSGSATASGFACSAS